VKKYFFVNLGYAVRITDIMVKIFAYPYAYLYFSKHCPKGMIHFPMKAKGVTIPTHQQVMEQNRLPLAYH